MVVPIGTSTLVDLLSVPIDTRGLEFALGIVFSLPAALVLGLLASLIAWAWAWPIPPRASFLWSIGTGAGLGIVAGLVGAAVSWVTWDVWDNPANAVNYTSVSIVYWTIIGLLSIGEVAAVVYVARHESKAGLPDALA